MVRAFRKRITVEMSLSRRVAFALPLLGLVGSARAQAWPTKPLRLVVPYPAGGSTDILARALAAKIGEGLGQQIMVDNKPGGAGNIGSDIGAKAAPDGHTLTVGNNATHATNQTLIAATPFDASKDFAAIGLTTTVTLVLVVHPEVPARTIQEFVTWAKAEGDKLSYASTGNGSASNLAMELFKGATGLQAVHVPYRGAAPAVQDLLGGQVKCSFQTMPSVLAQIRSGKLPRAGGELAQAQRQPARRADGRRDGGERLPGRRLVRPVRPGTHAKRISRSPECRDDQSPQGPLDRRGHRQGGLRHNPFKSHGIGRFRQARDRQMGQGGEGLRRQGGVVFCP
jgi:hypothetical protein